MSDEKDTRRWSVLAVLAAADVGLPEPFGQKAKDADFLILVAGRGGEIPGEVTPVFNRATEDGK